MALRFFFIACLVTLGINAQNKVFSIDAIGGLNVASLPDSTDFKSANYFHFGVSNCWQWNEDNSLRLDILYNRHGAKMDLPYFQYYFNYLEFPTYYEHQIFEDLYLELGIRTSYLLNAREVVLDGNQSSGKRADLIEIQESFNLGGMIGFRTTLQDNFGLYIRYDRSLTLSQNTIDHQGLKIGLSYVINRFEKVE